VIRYVVCPGMVVIRGQRRYVSYPELLFLYRVADDDCMPYDDGDPVPTAPEGVELVWLFPNAHGNYRVPTP
jgi:hypothetical protein